MPEETSKNNHIDLIDGVFLVGLILLGVGLAFAISWPAALVVVGGILVGVSLWLSTPISSKGND